MFAAMEKLQDAPACETRKLWPPISTLAVRIATVEFGLIVKFTVPKPEPVPPVTLTQDGPGSVLQAHPVAAIMFTDVEPPVEGIDAPDADKANVHPMPAWLTPSGCPAMVGVVDRLDAPTFAATSIVTAPDPVPVAAPLTVANAAPDAVHAHPGAEALTVTTLPKATAADTVSNGGEMVKEHVDPNCVTE